MLRVIHRIGGRSDAHGIAPGLFAQSPLVVDTCQRCVWLGQRASYPAVRGDVGLDAEYFSGRQAYEFLLRFATGLLSAVPGETNVFGQIKDAWRRHQIHSDTEVSTADRRLMAQLFADTKRIRRMHLQHIGGHTYGRLLCHLLEIRDHQPILIIGSGDIARSIAPALRKYPLAIWRRHSGTWKPDTAVRCFGPGDEKEAARWAAHIIFCTPPARVFEQTWRDVIGGQRVSSVVHLGYRDTPAWWHEEQRFMHLEHLFAVQRKRANVRSLQLARAGQECVALALGRYEDPADQIPEPVSLAAAQRV